MKKQLLLLSLLGLAMLGACSKPDPDPDPVDTTPIVEEQSAESPMNVFSVSASAKVAIANGNLQYNAAKNVWRIAPNAWDGSKEDNINASETYDGWIDYFGWGTSGSQFAPYTTSVYVFDYYYDGDIIRTDYDWGFYNSIQNGNKVDPAGTWRTISVEELDYLLNTRSTSTLNGVENARYANATVGDQVGIILFPDNLEFPSELALPNPESINAIYTFNANYYGAASWEKLKAAGCVFLPALGCKSNQTGTLISCDYLGCYWTGSYRGYLDDLYQAYQFMFNHNIIQIGQAGVQFPRCVRLVRDLK